MDWCFQIGFPNASRCCAYRSESSSAAWPTPSAREATWIRPISRPRIICANPSPSRSPSSAVAGHPEVVEGQLAALDALVAELGQVAGDGEAGARLGQDDADARRARAGPSGSVLHSSAVSPERRALVIQVLDPLMT